MNRRQLAFIVTLNAVISLVIALAVVWLAELRRPDPEALAALSTPIAAPVIAPTFTATPAAAAAQPAQAATAPAAAVAGEDNIYVVQAGDSLLGIATRVGVSMQAIMDANDLSNPDFIFSGQRLVIPRGEPQPTAAPAATATSAVTADQPAGAGLRIASFTGSGTLNSEAVQISNDSDLAVNLQGWRLEKEGGQAYTFGNVSLFPGGGVVLNTGPGTDTSVAVYWNQAAPIWAPGTTARLVNPQGETISQLAVP